VKHLNDEELLLLRGGYDGEQHLCLFTHDGTSFWDWWYCPGGCSSAEAYNVIFNSKKKDD
jgi:hypothetical protein